MYLETGTVPISHSVELEDEEGEVGVGAKPQNNFFLIAIIDKEILDFSCIFFK